MSVQPLTAFSLYLAGRHAVLLAIAAEVVRSLEDCDEHGLPAGSRGRASDLMWLWTLGAYEVVRTMCQAHGCFAPRFLREISALKAELERVRVPNTKMERIKYDRKDRAVPVPSDRAPDLWDGARRDLRVGDPDDTVSARRLLAAYMQVMGTLRADEVLGTHEASLAGR